MPLSFSLLHIIFITIWHTYVKTFQEEYRATLDKYGIDYDEQYLWD